MKKIILLLIFVISFFLISPNNYAIAESENNFFAKVQSTGVQFCSSPSENSSLFEIPYSYFVKVEYVVDDYYKVSYDGLEGYVKKSQVNLMKGKPTKPYANASYSVYISYPLYETPYSTSPIKTQLDKDATLKYYGTKIGEQLQEDNKIWYYSCFEKNGEKIYGYVFSLVAFNSPSKNISINDEIFETISDDKLFPSTSEFKNLSVGTKIMLIIAISVPSLLILYFLIKPSKIMQVTKTRKRLKKESRKIHHGDYFEFDESEL